MREPTAASHFTRNMFQSLAEEFLFDYLPDIIFSFVSHPPDIRYIQIYIFDTTQTNCTKGPTNMFYETLLFAVIFRCAKSQTVNDFYQLSAVDIHGTKVMQIFLS